MRIEHSTDIAAPAERVWDLTLDVEGWPATTPTVTSVERLDGGPLRPGSQALLKQPGQRPTVWTVTTVDPPQTFAWTARVFGVDMTGIHQVTPTADGCRNTLALELGGRGAGLLGRLLGRKLRSTLATENAGFAAAAEGAVSP